MKRHTLFIYIAALLTMLSTVLPLSAQNKSFTVNRNDGASQKYSYSQGDRLVLSREDSQGKKHADFVEQQVYVGNDVHNIPLTSIESITFDAQTTEDEGKSFVIQESGGKIEYDDITIDFPSGTFNSSTKVTVSEVEKGFIAGKRELSKYYKVKFSAGVRENFDVAIRMPQASNSEPVSMRFAMEGLAQSISSSMIVSNFIDVSYADGAYTAKIPEMENPNEAGEVEVYFGLTNVKSFDDSTTTRTRASETTTFNLTFDYEGSEADETAYKNKISAWIEEAIDKLESLHYRVPVAIEDLIISLEWKKKIKYSVVDIKDYKDFPPECSGVCWEVPWGNSFASILINKVRLGNAVDLRQTLIHETFHYYQQYYHIDPNDNIPRILEAKLRGFNGYTMLNEAAAVWSEKYMERNPSLTLIENIPMFLGCMIPEQEEIYLGGYGNVWEERYQNGGYGMAALLEYLTQELASEVVLRLFDERKRNGVITYFPDLDLARILMDYDFDFFNQKSFKDFVEKVGCNQLYKEPQIRGDGTKTYLNFQTLHTYNRRLKKGESEFDDMDEEIKDGKPVYLIRNAYRYGALIERLRVKGSLFTGDLSTGLDGVKGVLDQTSEGLTTWVYGYNKDKDYLDAFKLVGEMKKGSPLDITQELSKVNDKYQDEYIFFLVTIPDDFNYRLSWYESIQSKIEAKVEKVIEFEVSPNPLEFEAGGGTQKLTVTTNQPKFKSEQDEKSKKDGWLKISEVDGGVDVTATPNTEPKKREGYVIVTPINAAGKALEDLAVTIPVTQKPSFLVNVEPNPITLPGYGSEFKNGKMTSSFTVKYIKDAKSVNVRVEFEQDDKDKSWLTLDGDWATQTSDDMLFICKRNFTFTPNTSFTKSRSAKIIVELTMPDGSKPDPEIVPVTQEPMEGKLIIEAPDPLWLKAEEYAGAEFSDRQEVTINTNLLDEAIEKLVFKEEKLSSSKEWLKYEHKEKSKTIVIYADAYPEEKTPRDGIIYYSIVTTDGKEFPASVNVKQQGRGAGALFTINPSTIRFEAKASEMLVKVEGENVEGISSFDVQWPSWLGGAHSTLSKTLSLTATQNESKEERSKVFTLTVKMKNGDLVSRQFVAYQDGANDDEDPDAPYIAINSSLTFSNKGGSETVQYSTNQPDIAWETNCYWLTIEKTSDGLLVSAKPNLGNKDSSAKIIVYALDRHKNKVADVTINVKQQKGDGYKILVGKYYHERTKSVRDPEQGKYVEIVEWYDELSITESSYTIKHVSNTNPSASYTKTGNLKISKLEVYRLTPAMDESTGIFNRDVSNWTDYDGYFMSGMINIDGMNKGFNGNYIENRRYGHSYKLNFEIGGGDIHYKISNDPNDPILP